MSARSSGGVDIEAYLDALVDAAPPLSAGQRDQIAGAFGSLNLPAADLVSIPEQRTAAVCIDREAVAS